MVKQQFERETGGHKSKHLILPKPGRNNEKCVGWSEHFYNSRWHAILGWLDFHQIEYEHINILT